jgi:uncharacterized paraquat-inducible protein A
MDVVFLPGRQLPGRVGVAPRLAASKHIRVAHVLRVRLPAGIKILDPLQAVSVEACGAIRSFQSAELLIAHWRPCAPPPHPQPRRRGGCQCLCDLDFYLSPGRQCQKCGCCGQNSREHVLQFVSASLARSHRNKAYLRLPAEIFPVHAVDLGVGAELLYAVG